MSFFKSNKCFSILFLYALEASVLNFALTLRDLLLFWSWHWHIRCVRTVAWPHEYTLLKKQKVNNSVLDNDFQCFSFCFYHLSEGVSAHVFHILSPLYWRKEISDILCYGCAELPLVIKLVQQSWDSANPFQHHYSSTRIKTTLLILEIPRLCFLILSTNVPHLNYCLSSQFGSFINNWEGKIVALINPLCNDA